MAIIVSKNRPRSYKKTYTLPLKPVRRMGHAGEIMIRDKDIAYHIKLKRIPVDNCSVEYFQIDGVSFIKWIWYETEIE